MTSLVVAVGLVVGLCGIVAVLVGVSLMVDQYYRGERELINQRGKLWLYKGYAAYAESCAATNRQATPLSEWIKGR